jgi:hypothetical protein
MVMKKGTKAVRKAVRGGRGEQAEQTKAERKPKMKVVKHSADSAVRVLLWDPDLWAAVKEEAAKRGFGSRFVIDAAVQKESADLVADLRKLGFTGERPQKKVRQQLNISTLATLHSMSDATGLPMVKLLQMAVARQIGGGK